VPCSIPTHSVRLCGLKAGDWPVVEYYRGQKSEACRSSWDLSLSPAARRCGELAAKVRELNAEMVAAMRGQLDGLTEDRPPHDRPRGVERQRAGGALRADGARLPVLGGGHAQ
jgi:hypothetical protein